MPRNLKNWTYKDVEHILKSNFFELINIEGSHHYFKGEVSGKERLTWIPFHSNKSIDILTLKCAIHKSGMPEDYWKSWANGNKKAYKDAKNWKNNE